MGVSINMSDKDLTNRVSIPTKAKKKVKILPLIIGIVLVCVISVAGYFIYKGYMVSKDIGFNFSPGSILQPEKEPELKKDSTGKYTNVMLVGIDTRETGNLMNTDTIIIASYNYETNNVVMISIPRDFHVQVDPNKYWFNRINSVYSVNEQKEKDSGLDALKEVVQEVTDIEIQYYAMIDYNGFVDLIDAVGGVYVNVENSFTDYMYPKGTKYETVSFKEGPQLMDGTTALKYSRSRHSMQNNEGSDFARARRQQNVILAFKDTVLSSETLLNPKKIMDLMSAIQNNLKISEFTLDDIQAGVNILEKYSESQGKSYSFVLDPSSGNFTLITSENVVNTGAYAIGPIAGLGEYDEIKEYVSYILKEPDIYSQNPSIYVYNTGLGYQDTYKKAEELRKEYKYLNIKFLGTIYSDKENTYVYSNSEEDLTNIVSKFAQYLNTTNTSKPEYITTKLRGEDISILMGKEPLPQESEIEDN